MLHHKNYMTTHHTLLTCNYKYPAAIFWWNSIANYKVKKKESYTHGRLWNMNTCKILLLILCCLSCFQGKVGTIWAYLFFICTSRNYNGKAYEFNVLEAVRLWSFLITSLCSTGLKYLGFWYSISHDFAKGQSSCIRAKTFCNTRCWKSWLKPYWATYDLQSLAWTFLVCHLCGEV